MFIFFSIANWQSSNSRLVMEFVILSEELFLMYTFVQTIVDGVNITRVKSHQEIEIKETEEIEGSFTLVSPFLVPNYMVALISHNF